MSSILIIEDERVIRETLSEILQLNSYEVIEAENGEVGLKKARSLSPDLVICDIMMPKMNGMETIKAFRSSPSLKCIPFIFLSAMSEMEDIRKGMNLGAEDYLTKPFRPIELLSIIKLQLNKVSERSKMNDKESKSLENTIERLENEAEQVELKWQDSIESAGKIQSVILPKETQMKELFPFHFNYYRPKYKLSGDFYWIQKFDDVKLVAVADCTGHGISASLLTICCYNGLNIAVKQFGLKKPAQILKKVNELILDFINEHGGINYEVGMDILICSIDEHNRRLSYAGAKRPLYIISDNLKISPETNIAKYTQKIGKPLFRIRGDLYSIGSSCKQAKINEYQLKYRPGDLIYLCSDGYSDQFGGPDDKKFKSGNFNRLLLSLQNEDMKEQREIINQSFNLWKGNTEQTDDISILGIRLQ